ncbi:response regulator [Neotamlana laminarinivorans]|uniref:histidine kinase n=1 Tax=Neotamlana laminarinivorans TaxID=2883124 RepID=A0A9X1I0K5_9FLAO|nr:response regulator [Tamlana laminarinivorans]MCB4798725.1 response regulator [Tamlana laminarinivorans]
MNYQSKILILLTCFLWICSFGQSEQANQNSNTSKSLSEVLPSISKDSTLAEISNHVETMVNWMTTEYYKSNYVETLIYAEKGLYLSKKSKNSKYICEVSTIVGNTMLRINDTAGAKKIFLKALDEAKIANDSSSILKSIGNLANIYYYNPKYKYKTVEKYRQSINIAEKLKDTSRLFIIHHNLARIFNELKMPDSSRHQIKKTQEYLDKIGNPPHYKASHLHNYGRMYLLINEPDKAIEKFEQTIAICENTEYVEALIEGYEGYKEALEMKKDYKGLYDINKKLQIYSEKKDNDIAKNITDAVSAKINIERYKDQIKAKELEEKLLIQKAERKNILLIFIAGIGLFLTIILVNTYFAHKKKKVLVKDLKEKNKQYLIAKEESEKLAKSKEKFFATVSHELRTPLYGVIGLSSILMENEELKNHEKDLKSLKFSANYLLALINDLLQMNKIDNKSFNKEETVFNLKELINTIIFSFEYIKLQHGNDIRISISENSPEFLKGNSVMLSQILMNLIGNACKFTEDGTIEIIVNTNSNNNNIVELSFTIKDTGPGIEENKLKGIFNEFTQINSSNNRYQGTGLGLPIVKKLLNQSGSSISVESEVGKGTTFNFNLSFKVVEQHEKIKKTDTTQLAQKRILIVEDNRINQVVTKKVLNSENVNSDIAKNGEEAVYMVRNSYYDLILMDINMPVKNGIEATKEIRVFNNTTPIVALTAVEIESQKHQIFECGMNDIVLKPYDIDLFKQTIIENILTDKRKFLKKLG